MTLATHPNIAWHQLAGPVACVDVGGTKVAVAVADRQGVRAQRTEPTAKSGTPLALAEQIQRLVDGCAQASGVYPVDLVRVGVSSCGPFVINGGWIELAAPNICGGLAGPARGLPNSWMSAPLEAPLRQRYRTVRVENDGIAALEAERRWGALRTPGEAGRALSHCAYVTWSTGIGVGLCVDGHVLRGKNGNAGHAGHMYVTSNSDALCGCGNTGDLEALVAGNALSRRFGAEGFADAESLFAQARQGQGQVQGRALAIVDELALTMGRMLYNITASLDLERISIGGSVFWHQRDLLLPRLQAELARHLPPLTRGCEVVAAGLGAQVGDYAALALVMD